MEHPSDEALADFVDERAAGDIETHLEGCVACRARVEEMEAVVTALRAAPEMPSDAALAASRRRVMGAIARGAAIDSPPKVRRLRPAAWWWAPALAAAALAAVFVLRPALETARDDAVLLDSDDAAPLPLTIAARETALETVQALESAPEIEIVELPTAVGLSTPVEVPPPGPLVAEAELLDEFATLSTTDQEAILTELASFRLEL